MQSTQSKKHSALGTGFKLAIISALIAIISGGIVAVSFLLVATFFVGTVLQNKFPAIGGVVDLLFKAPIFCLKQSFDIAKNLTAFTTKTVKKMLDNLIGAKAEKQNLTSVNNDQNLVGLSNAKSQMSQKGTSKGLFSELKKDLRSNLVKSAKLGSFTGFVLGLVVLISAIATGGITLMPALAAVLTATLATFATSLVALTGKGVFNLAKQKISDKGNLQSAQNQELSQEIMRLKTQENLTESAQKDKNKMQSDAPLPWDQKISEFVDNSVNYNTKDKMLNKDTQKSQALLDKTKDEMQISNRQDLEFCNGTQSIGYQLASCGMQCKPQKEHLSANVDAQHASNLDNPCEQQNIEEQIKQTAQESKSCGLKYCDKQSYSVPALIQQEQQISGLHCI